MRRARLGTLAAAALLWSAVTWAADGVGSVAAIEGTAEVLRAGATEWAAITAGEPVGLGDHVRTLAGSKARLLLADDSVITLAASSELTVTEQVLGTTAPVSNLSLLVGTVRAIVTSIYGTTGAHFEVETPTAVAGVRGTGFIASYDQKADQTVVVGLFDTTRVRARGDAAGAREVHLGPGQTTSVGRGRFPVEAKGMPDSVLRGLKDATNLPVGGGSPERQIGPEAGAAAEPRVPRRSGQRATSPEGRVVDQPIDILKQEAPGGRKPPPPPPPPPRGP